MDELGPTRALVFGVLTEMLKQEQLISCFQGYTELIILKVLESHRDAEKDVSKFDGKISTLYFINHNYIQILQMSCPIDYVA